MREAHADVLWTDRITGFSRGRYLRQAFWKLNGVLRCRPMLDRERPRARRPLTRTVFSSTLMPPGWMWLSSNTPSYAGVRDIPGKILSADQARGLGTAVQLCWGDLMATLYFDWCGYERNRLQLIYLWMLEQLMDYCTAAQLCAARFAQGQVVLRHDPAQGRYSSATYAPAQRSGRPCLCDTAVLVWLRDSLQRDGNGCIARARDSRSASPTPVQGVGSAEWLAEPPARRRLGRCVHCLRHLIQPLADFRR
jgi:hypothetical protein